jgi:hypothetical protein
MKDKDQKLLWEAYVSETTHSPENSCKDDEFYCTVDKVCKPKEDKELEEGSHSHGYNQGKGAHWKKDREKLKKSNPDLPRMRAQAKKDKGLKLTDADREALGESNSDGNWTVQSKLDDAVAGLSNNDRWSDEVDLNAGMKDLISDNSDLVGDFYKVYDVRNPDHVEAHDEIVRSLWNTYNLLDTSVREFVGETKSKKPTESPSPGSQEDYDRMDIDDPNHWQNSGAQPPGY